MSRMTASHRLRFEWLCGALALLVAACGGPPPSTEAVPPGEWRNFVGNWTASGTRTVLDLGEHTASNVHLSGALLLTNNTLGVGFRSELIGFVDSRSGLVARAVWTDERGDKVFSELKGEWVGAGNHITGTFIGGTGRYAGVTGEYEFQWQYVLTPEAGVVSGRTEGFKGRARLATDSAAQPAEGNAR